MNKNIIFGIGAAIGGFALGVITDHVATKDAIDAATKTVEETAENIVKAQGAVDMGQTVIEDQNHIIDLLNNTIKEQADELKKKDKEIAGYVEEIGKYEAILEAKDRKEKVKEAIKNKKWDDIYKLTERWYNHYPVQMSRSEVFTNLEKDEYITQEERTEAYNYFGSLWNYVGD